MCKTTLARTLHDAADRSDYFDLERAADLAALEEPESTLASLRGLVVLDEVQRRPDLFPVLRELTDRKPTRARFLILGSASPDPLHQSSGSPTLTWCSHDHVVRLQVDG